MHILDWEKFNNVKLLVLILAQRLLLLFVDHPLLVLMVALQK
jgi:hypothetical protein